MLNITRSIRQLTIVLFILFSNSAFAVDTFEEYGTVERIDKVSKSIILDGRRFLVDGSVMVAYKNSEEHLLNVLQVGDIISALGKRDALNNNIIISAEINIPYKGQAYDR